MFRCTFKRVSGETIMVFVLYNHRVLLEESHICVWYNKEAEVRAELLSDRFKRTDVIQTNWSIVSHHEDFVWFISFQRTFFYSFSSFSFSRNLVEVALF